MAILNDSQSIWNTQSRIARLVVRAEKPPAKETGELESESSEREREKRKREATRTCKVKNVVHPEDRFVEWPNGEQQLFWLSVLDSKWTRQTLRSDPDTRYLPAVTRLTREQVSGR